MSPGLPTEDEITADLNKSSGTMNPADLHPSLQPPPIKKPNFIERLEDMRDAITDTEAYATLAGHGESVQKVASIMWSGLKRVGWVVSTSSLVLVIPLLYEIDKELGPAAGDAAAAVASTASSTPSSTSTSSASAAPASS